MAGRELARRIKEAAANAGPKPGNWMIDQVQDSMAELNQWSGKDYEGPLDPDPTTDPSRPSVDADDMPTTQDDPTDTIDELEIKIFGRDLRPSGLDQEFPRW